MVIFDEDLDNREVAERRGEVEVGIRKAFGGNVWVVDEFRMGLEDAFNQSFVVGVDCASKAEGRFDPVRSGTINQFGCPARVQGTRVEIESRANVHLFLPPSHTDDKRLSMQRYADARLVTVATEKEGERSTREWLQWFRLVGMTSPPGLPQDHPYLRPLQACGGGREKPKNTTHILKTSCK